MNHLKTFSSYLSTLGNGETIQNDEALEQCIKEIGETIRASVKGRSPSISPSGTARAPRYLKHVMEGNKSYNPDQFKPQAKLKMLNNSILEHVFVFLMKEAGINVEAPKNKVKIEIVSPQGNPIVMHGSYDYTIDDKIIDLKIVNRENFSTKFRSATALANGDIFGYLLQGHLYSLGEGKPFIGWDIFCADDMRMKYISSLKIQGAVQDKLTRFGNNYDTALEASASADLPYCHKLETHDRNGKPLGGIRLAWECSRCAFRDTCFTNLMEERKPNDVVRHWIGE